MVPARSSAPMAATAPPPPAPAARSGLAHFAHVLFLMLTWYTLGMGLVYVNKFMLTEEKFSFPFITVLVTNLWLWLAAVFLSTIGWFRPQSISWTLFRRQAVPTGICTGLDIATANWSLQYLNVTFFTMMRGTIPSFILVFSMCFGLERIELKRILATITVCVGIILASMGEVEFHVPGVVMCVLSCTIAGARWVLVELMMAKPQVPGAAGGPMPLVASVESMVDDGRPHRAAADGTTPLGTILLVTPVTICACAPFAAAFELRLFLESRWATDRDHRRQAALYLGAVTVLSFLLTLSKFHLVKVTSSLTMSLMGILKQLLQIFGAVALFGDRLTLVRALGFTICSTGLAFYNVVDTRALCGQLVRGGVGGAREAPLPANPWLASLFRSDHTPLELRVLLPAGRTTDDESGSDSSNDPKNSAARLKCKR